MKAIDIYEWSAGDKADFIKAFQDNEAMFKRAQEFWTSLESEAIILTGIFILCGVFVAWCYYKPYNEIPGRHYKLKYWFIFLLIALALSLVLTLLFEFITLNTGIGDSSILLVKIALTNALYAAGVYFLTSLIWCNFLPTNACRIFKF